MKTIGLFGIALNSSNYGVTALGISQIKVLEDISVEIDETFEYLVFSGENRDQLLPIEEYLPVQRIHFHDLIRYRTGISGIRRLSNAISKCDIVIDLTYGDSFSDIYGMKNYILYSLPKILAFQKLVLGPQTYGPFKHKLSAGIGKYIFAKTSYIFARDEQSKDLVASMRAKPNVLVTSDLAMELPYKKTSNSFPTGINVGLNVSNLLWHDEKSFGFKLDYKKFTEMLVDDLCDRFNVHLIAHTYDENDGEYNIAKEINNHFPKTILAPVFDSPISAKNYIANLDFFIGARMHATIGAFSAGVPVAPIAYSKKFEGLYTSLGYRHIIDCRSMTEQEAVNSINELITYRNHCKEEVANSLLSALNKNMLYKNVLKQLLSKEIL